MKTKTKFLLLIIVLLFAIALLPSNVFAGEKGDLTYEIDSNTKVITITKCKETATNVTIPSRINDYPVTVIGKNAFANCTNLKQVNIQSGIKTIESGAFEGCTNLTNISIPNTVTNINDYAFKGCSSLVTIKLPLKLMEICEGTFMDCSKLQNITIPNSVTKIGGDDLVFFGRLSSGAFENCVSLKTIVIPSSVKEIDGWAFWGCTSLNNVTIPSSVEEIQRGIFYECTNLKTVTLKNKNISNDMFNGCTNLTTVNISNNIESIGSAAFKNCKNLKSFNVPSKVTELKEGLFEGCTSLKNVKIPMFVTNLGSDLFKDTSSNLVVSVVKGSEAEMYMINNNIKYTTYIISLSDCSIPNITNKVYTGKNIVPSVTVKYGNIELVKGTHYTVSCVNNKNPGRATVTISGKGSYTGTVKKYFYIVPKKVSGLKVKSQTTSSITLNWSKATGASAYELYKYNSSTKKWQKFATTSKTSYTIKKLKAGRTYKYRVRVYRTINGKKYYGSYSNVLNAATKTSTPKISKITSKSKKATLTWKKVSGASGYEVYMATSKKGKYKKITTVGSRTSKYTKSSLKKKKTYYFKIRAYRTVNGKKVYSSYSSIKSIKIK